jgi:LysM repeat protein
MKIRLPVRKPGPPSKQPPRLKLKASVARSRRAPIVEEEDFLEEPEPNMKLSHAFVVVLVLHVIAVAGVFAFNSIKTRQADIISPIANEPAATAETTAASTASASAPEAAEPSASAGASLPEQVSSATPAVPAGKTHELQPGETLTKVAKTYGISVADLQSANNIEDPKTIRAGSVLMIPGGSEPTAKNDTAPRPLTNAPVTVAPVEKSTSPAPVTTGGVKDSGKTYVVVKGDNPVKIAKRLKVPYAALMAINGNPDPTHLQIGQKLKIPATAK